MASNSFGEIFRITTFGESHGQMIGVIIDGCPAGIFIDESEIKNQLARRRTAQSIFTSGRKEDDSFEIVSGYFENKTTGAPITFIIKNMDVKSDDYINLENTFRPSHADFTYSAKYGNRDYRGGGRSSARETTLWVIAGTLANQILLQNNIRIKAYVSAIGNIATQKNYQQFDFNTIDSNEVRCPDDNCATQMIEYLNDLKQNGDTTGGVITCVVQNMIAGLGDPIFEKLQSKLAAAMFCINTVHGFEYGSGFAGASMNGSMHNDLFNNVNMETKSAETTTNNSGGIQGGISNGMDIFFNVAFKPIASIKQEQVTANVNNELSSLVISGRHDACVVPRAVPIVEAMTALTLLNAFLKNNAYNNLNLK